jgi:hypothetical protein
MADSFPKASRDNISSHELHSKQHLATSNKPAKKIKTSASSNSVNLYPDIHTVITELSFINRRKPIGLYLNSTRTEPRTKPIAIYLNPTRTEPSTKPKPS